MEVYGMALVLCNYISDFNILFRLNIIIFENFYVQICHHRKIIRSLKSTVV